MKKIFFLILILILLSAFKCGGDKPNIDNSPNDSTVLQVYSQSQQRTPKGALVASQSGVNDEKLNAIDEVLTDLFLDAETIGYTQNLLFGDYIIYILPNCVPSPESGTRAFLIRADSYDGTAFDRDPRPSIGKIFAAEQVIIEPNGFVTNEYVICDAPAVDAEFRDAVRFGPEHIILNRNNLPEYERTKFHGGGVGHPILPRRNAGKTENLFAPIVLGAIGEAKGRVNQ